MAKQKIVLRTDVDALGKAGEIVTVSGGFARNFLVPRGLAAVANRGNIAQSAVWKAEAIALVAKGVESATGLKATLESAAVVIKTQSGPDGRLFGSVTTAQISKALKIAFGVDVDRHTIELAEPIRSIGFHTATVKIHKDISANVTVETVTS